VMFCYPLVITVCCCRVWCVWWLRCR